MKVKYLQISANFHNQPFTAVVKLPMEQNLDQKETALLICNDLQTNVLSEISSTTTLISSQTYDVFTGKKYDLTNTEAA